jgi:hypothetical protein
VKVTIEVSDDTIADYIGRANITYWAETIAWNRTKLALMIKEDDPDAGSDGRHHIGRDAIAAGLGALATKYPSHFADLVGDKGDMYTGDLLIQCCVFGEDKYA